MYRLGNMVLLEEGLNRRAGNSSFQVKKSIYAESNLAPVVTLSENEADWDDTQIHYRQQRLARLATSVWRVAQLHS